MGRPSKPSGMNGDISHLWDFIGHLTERIDKLYMVILGGTVAILVSVIGTLVAVILK
jgi:hypothetical protein